MKKTWIVLFAVLFGWMSMVHVAEAKRFGGGKSFGYSKSVPSKSYSSTSKTADSKTQTATTKPTSAAGKWLGPLAGLAAGGLLAAMLFGDGFEGIQVFDLLMFALIAFMLFKLFAALRARQAGSQSMVYSEGYVEPRPQARRARESMQMRQAGTPQPAYDSGEGSIIGSALGQEPSAAAVKVDEVPSWFDAEQFVEGAKQHFVTLQKAWDDLNVSEIESYCTPELFAAIQEEMKGRQPGDNVTVVDTLNAEVADMAIDGDYFVVSLRFSGFIQEASDEDAHAFNEVWHIRRNASDQGNWEVAGIQQIH